MDYLMSLAVTLINLVCEMLPLDGLQTWISNIVMEGSAILTGLSWLNWFVDLNGMNLILDVWLIGMAAYYVFKYGVNIFNNMASVYKQYAGLNDE